LARASYGSGVERDPGQGSTDHWLAIDVATAPMVRAHELRHAWERFVEALPGVEGDEQAFDLVRAPIADSWRRSHAAGVDPSGHELAPVVADEIETRALLESHPLGHAGVLIHECLAAIAEEAGYLIVVSDAAGLLLSVEGSSRVRMRAAQDMNFVEGTLWSEPGAGTNAIGTALAADHAVQVFGPEHFSEAVQRWTCSAAPIHDPDTGALLGVIDLTGDFSTVHPHSLAVAAATAKAVEASLCLRMQEHDDRLRARYGSHIAAAPGARALVAPTGRALTRPPPTWGEVGRLDIPPGGGRLTLPSGDPAVAEPVAASGEVYVVRAVHGGMARDVRPVLKLAFLGRRRAALETADRRLELRPRLGEIAALLCASPEGMSAERLCADLHGDTGSPSGVRVEVSRLRKLLGPWVDTERYRLTCDVETDVRRLEGLLRAGAVREAAEAYGAGPLLPESDAPGIVRERERLEGWLRSAVMTADDPEALWAWAQSPSGADDLEAWKRVLSLLEFRDPRRSLASSHVARLRRAYTL
jgi:GAF domain-containing protein